MAVGNSVTIELTHRTLTDAAAEDAAVVQRISCKREAKRKGPKQWVARKISWP